MVGARSRHGLVACVTAVALTLSACGGDEQEAGTTQTGASGATGVEGAAYEITVGEFIAELQPQKTEILEALVAVTPGCEDVEVDGGFVLLVSARAIDADPEASLESIVTGEC